MVSAVRFLPLILGIAPHSCVIEKTSIFGGSQKKVGFYLQTWIEKSVLIWVHSWPIFFDHIQHGIPVRRLRINGKIDHETLETHEKKSMNRSPGFDANPHPRRDGLGPKSFAQLTKGISGKFVRAEFRQI
jgi:hypothetical protein